MRTSWRRSPDRRGRQSYDAKSLEYLIYLSHIHNINSYELLHSFTDAKNKKTAICGPLTINLRKKEKDYMVFLITKDSKIVAQIRMRNELCENSDKLLNLYTMLVNDFPPLHQ